MPLFTVGKVMGLWFLFRSVGVCKLMVFGFMP